MGVAWSKLKLLPVGEFITSSSLKLLSSTMQLAANAFNYISWLSKMTVQEMLSKLHFKAVLIIDIGFGKIPQIKASVEGKIDDREFSGEFKLHLLDVLNNDNGGDNMVTEIANMIMQVKV